MAGFCIISLMHVHTPLKGRDFLKKTEFAVLIGLVVTIIFSSLTAFAKDCENMSESILRLHVIAHDDSGREQNLKLLVRDEILKTGGEIFKTARDKTSAKELVFKNREKLEQAGEKILRENGSNHDVKIELCEMFFSTKTYENFAMPAGVYDAVRVTIGKGEGKNWWCVMFPPMCLSACTDLDAALGEDGEAFLEKSPKYVAKFKVLEWIEKLFTKAEKYEK